MLNENNGRMLNRAPAQDDSFVKRAISGKITNYEISTYDGKLGSESLKLTVRDLKDDREKIVFVSMAVKIWSRLGLDNGDVVYQAPSYSEYGNMKSMAEKAGVNFYEEIELVPESERKDERDPAIRILELCPEPEIFDYYISLGVVDKPDRNTGKIYPKYVTTYFGKTVPEGTKTSHTGSSQASKSISLSPAEARKAMRTAATGSFPSSEKAPEKATENGLTVSDQFNNFVAELAYKLRSFNKKELISAAKEYKWDGQAIAKFKGIDPMINVDNLYEYLDKFLQDGVISKAEDGKFIVAKK
jgi:hypothetical protein